MKNIATLKNKKQKSKGFTLVELVVVMAAFLLIIGVAISIFISIIQGQRRILAQNQLLNQSSYLIEYMSKGLRMARNDEAGTCLIYADEGSGETSFPGYNYLFTKPVSNNYTGIKFINANSNDCQEFYLDSEDNKIKELRNSINESDAMPLMSDKFNVNYFKATVNALPGLQSDEEYGSFLGDFQQPRITIISGFSVVGDNSLPELKIQTTVSQRNLNE